MSRYMIVVGVICGTSFILSGNRTQDLECPRRLRHLVPDPDQNGFQCDYNVNIFKYENYINNLVLAIARTRLYIGVILNF